jgi:hypothetical protein
MMSEAGNVAAVQPSVEPLPPGPITTMPPGGA